MFADLLVVNPLFFDQLLGAAMQGEAALLGKLFNEFFGNQAAQVVVERSSADRTVMNVGLAGVADNVPIFALVDRT